MPSVTRRPNANFVLARTLAAASRDAPSRPARATALTSTVLRLRTIRRLRRSRASRASSRTQLALRLRARLLSLSVRLASRGRAAAEHQLIHEERWRVDKAWTRRG